MLLRNGAEYDVSDPVQTPPLLALQSFNALVSIGSILALMLGTTWWTKWQWSAFEIGVVTTVANLCYGGLVSLGGRLADRWGRARSGILGSGIGMCGCLVAVFSDSHAATVVAAMAGFIGAALFFPGSAGLFSDAEGAAGGPPPKLHVKIRRYNLGWAIGNVASFIGFGVLESAPRAVGYSVSALAFFLVAMGLWKYRSLPRREAAPAEDRAPHPALTRLTLMYRVNLFIACILGMALITQLQKSLSHGLSVSEATTLASIALTCYSASYMLMFMVLGSWTGWILKPWALWRCQTGYLIGGAGLMVVAYSGHFHPLWFALCGGLIGSGYGAAYVGSIYYSLRLPDGVGRAAGLHETFIGLGNTMGPLLAGTFMSFMYGGITGLSVFLVITAVLGTLVQCVLIPGAARLGAR
jgi:MFS family permease